jgi:ATP-dependent helicase/nuclease subunit B
MLSIWIGRAGSGKSQRILEAINQNRGNRGQILLVPEHTTHASEVDLCTVCGDTASKNAEVLSLRTLATRVLAQTGGLADFTLDGGGKLLTMYLALTEVQSKLKVFARPSQRAAFLQQLVDVMEEFAAYEIAPETLYDRAELVTGAAGDKLRDLALLYAAYDGKIRTGVSDGRDRVQKLRDALPKSDYAVGKDIYVDGFSYFTALEEEILGTLLRQAHSLTVTLLGEKGRSDFFENALRQRERLVYLAQKQGVEAEICYLPKPPAKTPLGHLEEHFFGTDEAWPDGQEAISLYAASTAETEVSHVAAEILRLVRSGDYRFRDIGVTCRSLASYGSLIENIFGRYQIPAYLSTRTDILQKPVMTLLLGALDAVTGGFEYEDMFAWLKTGLAGISRDDCDKLENYVILWGIRGSMWLRDVPWTANPDGYGQELTEERAARLAEINAIREQVRVPLVSLSDSLHNAESARAKATALYTFCQDCGVPETLQAQTDAAAEAGEIQLAEENAQLWKIFVAALDQFAGILGDTAMDGEEFAKVLRLVLSQSAIATIPATLDQVKVAEMTRNERREIKCLFLLGANDSLLPLINPTTGILSAEEREELHKHDIALSDATFDPLDQEMQNIYACLAQPTERLAVSYALTDVNGSELRPSFVCARLLRLFPTLSIAQDDGAYRFAAAIPALEAAGENQAVWDYFAATDPSALRAMERGARMERGRLSESAVQTLYGSKIRMSASRMDRVKSCHFGYFMEYGLRAKERKTAGFEAPEIGTFLHYLLENVTREALALGGYAKVEPARLRELIRRYTKAYTETQIDGYAQKSARFRYLFARLESAAVRIMEELAGELAVSDFQPVAFELSFGAGREIPAVTAQYAGTELSVSGKVDRVDGWLHDGKLYLRVVDYKTGKKAFDLADVRYGLGIQMLLYLFTLQQEGQAFFGQPIEPAGVLYMPARDVILREKRTVSEEDLKQERHRELARTGLLLRAPEVLQAMEHDALEKPCYLPLRIGKDGSIGGSVASAEDLGALGGYIDDLLVKIAQEMHEGNIDADPISHSPTESACTYCAYATACGFEDGCGRDRLRQIRKTPPDEFWATVRKGGADHE